MPAGMWVPTRLTALFLLTTWRLASHGVAGAATDGPRVKRGHEDLGSSGGPRWGWSGALRARRAARDQVCCYSLCCNKLK